MSAEQPAENAWPRRDQDRQAAARCHGSLVERLRGRATIGDLLASPPQEPPPSDEDVDAMLEDVYVARDRDLHR